MRRRFTIRLRLKLWRDRRHESRRDGAGASGSSSGKRIASAYDPLSGAGISKASHFAPLAAQASAAALAQNRAALAHYADAVKRDFSTYLKQRLAEYTQEQRWLAPPFWQRRHTGPVEMTELPPHVTPACAAERSVAAGRLAHVECETPL